jgi:hypothetical protein
MLQECLVAGTEQVEHFENKNQFENHALPHRGFGLSTPSGAEWKGATPSNMRHRRLRESRQGATLEPRSEHTL